MKRLLDPRLSCDGLRRARRAGAFVRAAICLAIAFPSGAVTMGPSAPAMVPDGARGGAMDLVHPGGTAAADGAQAVPDFGPAGLDSATGSSQALADDARHGTGVHGDPLTRDVAADPMVEYLSMGAAPVAAGDRSGRGAASIAELLRGVITVHGRSGPGSSGRPRPPAVGAGGDPLSLMLQPLAAEVLDAAITSTQTVDGRKVFSVFGGGAFVLEASREAPGITLSELNTGSRIVLGADPGRVRPAASSGAGARHDTPVPVAGAAAHYDGGEMSGLMGTFARATGKLVGTLTWFGESPLRLLMLVPLVLLVAVVEFFRRDNRPAVQVEEPAAGEPVESTPEDRREGSRRRHRHRKSRRRHRDHVKKKSGWRAIIAGIRESLGFPEAERLREKDFPGRRRKHSRRHARRTV